MRTLAFTYLSLLSAALMVTSCGGEKAPRDQASITDTASTIPFVADSLLPESTSSAVRQAGTRIILGTDADEFAGSSANLYRDYRLVGLVSARYEVGGIAVFAEIAQCATDTEAYGLYASTRPDGVVAYRLGAEGYLLGNSLHFTQDQYVVTLSTFAETENGRDAMRLLAVTISARIGTAGALPGQFGLFPDDKQILPSTRYYRSGFLDIPGLDHVFTASYVLNHDTLVLFLTNDKHGTKFIRVREYARRIDKPFSNSAGISFDEDYGLTFSHPECGTVLAGLKDFKLVGAVGYDASGAEAFVSKWAGDL